MPVSRRLPKPNKLRSQGGDGGAGGAKTKASVVSQASQVIAVSKQGLEPQAL